MRLGWLQPLSTLVSQGYRRWSNDVFGQLDTRPLSLFRLGMGLLLLKDALLRLLIAGVFYSDTGVVPREVVGGAPTHISHLSLMNAVAEPWMAAAFFGLWAVVAVGLLVGFHTRLMSLLNFILIVSVHARNPYLVTGADDMLRLLSFWMLFIPLNHHFSVDDYLLRRRGRTVASSTLAFPVRLLQMQVAISYLAAGLFKLNGTAWRSGSAVYEVLHIDSMLRPAGQWLAANSPDGLLAVLTYGVIISELGFIVLVFAPFGQPFLRYTGIALVGLMHLGIALTMTTPLFDFLLVFSVSYLTFLPHTISAVPAPEAASRRQYGFTFALGAIMLLVVWENVCGVLGLPTVPILHTGIQAAGLGQAWTLFSPEPLQTDAYIAVPGTFVDGKRIDLRTGYPVEGGILPLPSGLDAYRWGGFQLQVLTNRSDDVLDAWSQYYCRVYNTAGSQPALLTVQLRVISRRIHAAGQRMNPIRNDLLWLQACPRASS